MLDRNKPEGRKVTTVAKKEKKLDRCYRMSRQCRERLEMKSNSHNYYMILSIKYYDLFMKYKKKLLD